MSDPTTQKEQKQRQHENQIAAARVKLQELDFATDAALQEHLATLPAKQAHYLWLASLEPAELAVVEREGVAEFVDPDLGRFAKEFDESRDDKSAEECALLRRLEMSGPITSPVASTQSEKAFDLGEAIMRVVLMILDSQNLEAAVWGLALHSGAASQLGIETQLEAAERLGISKQSLNAHVQRFAELLGPISKKFHTTAIAEHKKQVGEKHWRKSRTVQDALK